MIAAHAQHEPGKLDDLIPEPVEAPKRPARMGMFVRAKVAEAKGLLDIKGAA